MAAYWIVRVTRWMDCLLMMAEMQVVVGWKLRDADARRWAQPYCEVAQIECCHEMTLEVGTGLWTYPDV